MFKRYKEDRRSYIEVRNEYRKGRKRVRDDLRSILEGFRFEMDSDRLAAFTDAVVAIIMTILVLELEKPEHMSWQNLWNLRANFFAYILSFSWLAAMWINLHYDWKFVKKTSRKTAWAVMNLLLWSSFLSYATNIMARDFYNQTAQIFYGGIIVMITLAIEWVYRTIEFKEAFFHEMRYYQLFRQMSLQRDLISKFIFLLLTIFVYPPLMSFGILIDLFIMRIPGQIRG